MEHKEKQTVPGALLALVAGILITIVSLWYGQNNHLLPEQASVQAPLVDDFFNIMVTIGTALFIVVEGTIILFAIQFRHRKGDDGDGVPIKENFGLEVFWTAIPAIIVIGLGAYSVEVYRDMGGFSPGGSQVVAHVHPASHVAHNLPRDSAIAAPLIAQSDVEMTSEEMSQMPADPKAEYGLGAAPAQEGKVADVTVNVSGMQYAWIFTYPVANVISGELHVPVGKDVQLNLSAVDVIHSFWVPNFRLKQDAIPGVPTELRFVATKPGDYPIFCAELCGSYHGAMKARVIVETEEEYETWLKESQIAQQQDINKAVAVNPADLPASEFLAPYATEMGINAKTIAKLHK
jgi:cytochrome c oxidase subunit II